MTDKAIEAADEARDVLNEIAWRDFVTFAWMQEDAHKAFRGATGRPQMSKTTSPLDAMIDKACGGQIDDAYMHEFIDWVTKNHWGENYAPEKWRNRPLPPPPGKEG